MTLSNGSDRRPLPRGTSEHVSQGRKQGHHADTARRRLLHLSVGCTNRRKITQDAPRSTEAPQTLLQPPWWGGKRDRWIRTFIPPLNWLGTLCKHVLSTAHERRRSYRVLCCRILPSTQVNQNPRLFRCQRGGRHSLAAVKSSSRLLPAVRNQPQPCTDNKLSLIRFNTTVTTGEKKDIEPQKLTQ